ncbi:MAG: parallel beta-helix domain-containing protein [Saprospiraceae bacterium]|nr:parallel beta-helix domain-containing protein [Saprospiraceae bacterium]
MKPTYLLVLITLLGVIILFSSCEKEDDPIAGKKYSFSSTATDADVQTAMIQMKDGDTIYFEQGNYTFTTMLSIDAKDHIVIMGDGRDKTILSFKNQTSGAQSIYGTNLTWALFRDFTVSEPIGDGIKVKDSDGITFLRLGVVHLTSPESTNGGYGLYPVTCINVLVDDCYVYGTSDAGIYVGQSRQVIVRNSETEGNVAGIEIENCISADVYNNNTHDNAAGIVILDLPDLPAIKNGHTIRVFNNTIVSNDLVNFALPGNIVAGVPTGTGIMLMSSKNVEVFGNTITENNVMDIGVISYNTLVALSGLILTDTVYVSYNKDINIHNNVITSSATFTQELNPIADLIVNVLFGGGDVPEILFDGFVHPDHAGELNKGICINNNGSAVFSNMDVPNSFAGLNFDVSGHVCSPASLPEVVVMGPMN